MFPPPVRLQAKPKRPPRAKKTMEDAPAMTPIFRTAFSIPSGGEFGFSIDSKICLRFLQLACDLGFSFWGYDPATGLYLRLVTIWFQNLIVPEIVRNLWSTHQQFSFHSQCHARGWLFDWHRILLARIVFSQRAGTARFPAFTRRSWLS